MVDIRLTFSKKGRAKYISHLDLNKTMQRAFKRAKIPLWYTEGFNPHAYIMFPLALSLGVDSDCEILDFKLDSEMDFEIIKNSLNNALPEGLKINKVAYQIKNHTEIMFSEYRLTLSSEISPDVLKEKFDDFLALEKIEIEKRSKKKGIVIADIKPMINVISTTVNDKSLSVDVILPSGTNMTLNPIVVFETFSTKMNIEALSAEIERKRILCEDSEDFA
ncbi:MAG: TIGR03936 family radical SAM-associated protein [Oscillospiraceae bacterium]